MHTSGTAGWRTERRGECAERRGFGSIVCAKYPRTEMKAVMNSESSVSASAETAAKDMDQLVSLCRRRGFLFQSSEIYGGLGGFWDYGPLGVELKRNVKEAWWRDMVTAHDELSVAEGAPSTYEMTGLDCTIVMHPQVWKCSGHFDLFHDYMVDCRESKRRYRHDQVQGRWVGYRDAPGVCGDSAIGGRGAGGGGAAGAEVLQAAGEGSGAIGIRRRAGFADDDRGFCRGVGPRREGVGNANGAARIQPDVQDVRGRAGRGGERGVSAAGDGAGNLRELQKRARQFAGADSVWHRADGQEFSE